MPLSPKMMKRVEFCARMGWEAAAPRKARQVVHQGQDHRSQRRGVDGNRRVTTCRATSDGLMDGLDTSPFARSHGNPDSSARQRSKTAPQQPRSRDLVSNHHLIPQRPLGPPQGAAGVPIPSRCPVTGPRHVTATDATTTGARGEARCAHPEAVAAAATKKRRPRRRQATR